MAEEVTTEVSVINDESEVAVLILTEEDIATTKRNIEMAERLVMKVMERDIDYGIHPGTDTYALRDSGASKIANAFNTYPDHIILSSREDENAISYLVQAKLINRNTGRVVAVGVGSCSTMESKYGYRWVENPEDYGYKREDLTRRRKGKYRIPNPEIADLGNTILKMGAKRAEIDACQNLPGVGSALKKLFGSPQRKDPDWNAFWGHVAQLGLSEERAHQMLGVTSVNQWTAQGKTLDQAIRILSQTLSQGVSPSAIQKAEEGIGLELPAKSKPIEASSLNREELIEELTTLLRDRMEWQPKTCEAWLMQNFGYGSVEEMPTESIEEAVRKAAQLAGKKSQKMF